MQARGQAREADYGLAVVRCSANSTPVALRCGGSRLDESLSATMDPTWRSHLVLVSATAADSTSAAPAPAARWYPLHQLARWSGAVAVAAPAPVVKRALAEARATCEAHCRAKKTGLEDVYRKIGQTM